MTHNTASVRTAMPGHETPSVEPTGDPWQAFGYLTAGVMFYGFLGWVADRWLGTSWLVAVGIVGGAALGIYLTWVRFNKPAEHGQNTPGQNDTGELS